MPTELLILRWRLQPTTEYKQTIVEDSAALSNAAGYVSACTALTLESAVMKEDLYRADLISGPAEIEPAYRFCAMSKRHMCCSRCLSVHNSS